MVVWSKAVVAEMKKRGKIGELFRRQSHQDLLIDRKLL